MAKDPKKDSKPSEEEETKVETAEETFSEETRLREENIALKEALDTANKNLEAADAVPIVAEEEIVEVTFRRDTKNYEGPKIYKKGDKVRMPLSKYNRWARRSACETEKDAAERRRKEAAEAAQKEADALK